METIYEKLKDITAGIKEYSAVIVNEDMNDSNILSQIENEVKNFNNPEQTTCGKIDLVFEPGGDFLFIFKKRRIKKVIHQKGIINAFFIDNGNENDICVSSRNCDKNYSLF